VQGYAEFHTDTTVCFVVRLTAKSANWNDHEIEQRFKLAKSLWTTCIYTTSVGRTHRRARRGGFVGGCGMTSVGVRAQPAGSCRSLVRGTLSTMTGMFFGEQLRPYPLSSF
jgi:hypothetical protein